MSQQTRRVTGLRGLRVHVLLVLAVLAGIVAMHGLGPVPAAPGAVSAGAHHRAAVAVEAPAHGHEAAKCDCAHADDHSRGAGGHAEHADETCAAGGTSAAPVLPSLAPSGALAPPATNAPAAVFAADSGGRAPPTLSELQLLRI